MYLIMYGLTAVLILLPRRFPSTHVWSSLLIVSVLFLTMSLAVAITGFLYITTDLHERICKGGAHAAEN